MDTQFLYYKKYKSYAVPVDYVNWAFKMLGNELSSPSLNILASLREPFNIFEVERYFKNAMFKLKLPEPSHKESAEGYVQYLMQQIILGNGNVIDRAYEVYKILREYWDYDDEKLIVWYRIIEMIDDFYYGDNVNNITEDFLLNVIAREANVQLEKGY
ncbi:hypothetical protein [Solibacillus sp. FSL K6-4121]|uniref:hypothetical protein n=1 Tax=Solibacillus sp. FSL K6-4121 TaxID=2921505 RepID=UPI0030FCDE67